MSAIAGIVNFDGAVDVNLLGRMANAGARRGPDLAGEWHDGSVGFTYRGLAPAGPEGPVETQPLRNADTGIVVVLDGQIHARAELRAACLAAGHPARTLGDAELVLRAYQAWGEECPRHLLGEYAFALWDPARRRLVCARDSAGTRPLYYAETPRGSVRFATGANQLGADPDLARKADLPGMVDFLVSAGACDPQRTPWASVRRLPAAHTLVADARGTRIARHWSLDDEAEAAPPSQEHAVAAFAEALQVAIRDRVRGLAPIGMSLSGGYDSGALFTLWQWMRSQGEPLPQPWTHTHYWDYPEADERAAVRTLLARWPADGTFMHVSTDELLVGLEEHAMLLGMPEPAFGWHCLRRQGAEARAAGVRAILTGEGGNFVAESSPLRVIDLFRVGRLREGLAQLRIVAKELERPSRALLWPYLARPALTGLFPAVHDAARELRRALARGGAAPPYVSTRVRGVVEDLVRPLSASRRRPAGASLAAWDRRTRLEGLLRQLFPLPSGPSLEGVTLSAPYFDRRVIRTALAAVAGESSPAPAREALGCVLERTVGHRLVGNYAHVTRGVNDGMRAALRAGHPLFRATFLEELGIVNGKHLRTFLEEYAAGRDEHWVVLWRLVSLEAWGRCWLGREAGVERLVTMSERRVTRSSFVGGRSHASAR